MPPQSRAILGGALPQSFEEQSAPIYSGYGVTAPPQEGKKTPQGLNLAYKKTCASEFSGEKGYRGDSLGGKNAFAELVMGTALGGLKYKQKIVIRYGGKSVIAEKLDIGLGGAPCGGHLRGIDLYQDTAQKLGLHGLGVVEWAPVSGVQLQQAGFNLGELLDPFNLGPFEHLGENVGKFAAKPLQPFEQLNNFLGIIGKVFKFISSGAGWTRIGKVVLGFAILLIALIELGQLGVGSQGSGVTRKLVGRVSPI